ncbi:MAG: histidine phosphatase family protein [Planctomycetia bacterium]|nr:histidine phosphatase family protein [Planctomycetia bacterium]
MIVYCVRHGESCYNAEGRLQGQSHTPLSPLGRRQAEALAATLGGRPMAAVYSSPLARAVQTAEPVARALGLSVETDPRLMEIDVGIFQDLLHAEIPEKHPAETAAWRASDPDFRIPGGESRRDLMLRGRAAFDAIRAREHAEVVVVSHGGLFAAVFKSLLEIPAERNPFTLANASISELAWAAREVKLLTLNQVDHLHAAGCAGPAIRGDFF